VRLLAEVARVDQEQDAAGAAELEQAVDRGDRGEGFPAPVAMCTSARGLAIASDFSSPVTALIWQSRRFRAGSGGVCSASRCRRVSGCAAQVASVRGWKKWNTSRARGRGSPPSVKWMIWPVLS